MSLDTNKSLITVLQQIEAALKKWEELAKYKKSSDFNDGYYKINEAHQQEIVTLLCATIDRLAPTGSRYRSDIHDIFDYYRKHRGDNPEVIDRLAGILKALKSDYEAGYLKSVQELIHGDIFADFLEMADYFLEQNYKDPAAVMAGGVLEEHLRKLCLKNDLPIEDVKEERNIPKTGGRLNDDLAVNKVYGKLDQKTITVWLDLRNKAAHGKYDEYHKQQVTSMVQGIRDFLIRYPA